jgi:hypothetical protein
MILYHYGYEQSPAGQIRVCIVDRLIDCDALILKKTSKWMLAEGVGVLIGRESVYPHAFWIENGFVDAESG